MIKHIYYYHYYYYHHHRITNNNKFLGKKNSLSIMGQCVDKDATIEQHDEKTSTLFNLWRIFFFFFLENR